MVKKHALVLGVSFALNCIFAVQATPARRFVLAAEGVLSRELVKRVKLDPINGKVSPREAFENVVKLCFAGADVNAIDPKTGESALTVAAWYNTPKVVATLLEEGADPNHQNINEFFGRAPLHAAATRDSTLFINMLLAFGAEVNVPDKDGRMPVDYATHKDCIINAMVLANNGALITPQAIENLKNFLREPRNCEHKKKFLMAWLSMRGLV